MMRFVLLSLMLTGTVQAAEPVVYGLTPAEKAQVLESASQRPDADNPALLPAQSSDRRPHGEVGMMVGTGGARGIYGVVGVPIGENGSAVMSFSNTQMPGYYGYGPFGNSGPIARNSFGLGLRQQGW